MKDFVVLGLIICLLLVSCNSEEIAKEKLTEEDGITQEMQKGIGDGDIAIGQNENVAKDNRVTIEIVKEDENQKHYQFMVYQKGMTEETYQFEVYLNGKMLVKERTWGEDTIELLAVYRKELDTKVLQNLEIIHRDKDKKIIYYRHLFLKIHMVDFNGNRVD